MTPLYTPEEIRAVERAAFARRPSFAVMRDAAAAVAEAAADMLPAGGRVVAVAGGGNNGGDALCAAALLHRAGYAAEVILAADAAALSADAAQALKMWRETGKAMRGEEAAADALQNADLIVDGVFGIGLNRAPAGENRRLIERINAAPAPVLAIDAPSGLCARTGAILGAAVCAHTTVTFFGGKPGLYTGDGRDVAGRVLIAALGETPPPSAAALMTEISPPPRRRRNSHKGDYGLCRLVGGSAGMLGALILAARAAAIIGAGKTMAHAAGAPPPADWLRPDIMWGAAADAAADDAAACTAAGMGLGLDAAAADIAAALLPLESPLLLDADALTLLARLPALANACQKRRAPTIITPHAAEAARLLQTHTAAVNADRPAAARELAARYNAVAVLKGAGTIVHSPDGGWVICAAGNPGLARGGSGDVLSGIIAGLMAQCGDAELAARNGVFLHAAAADALAAQYGETGVNVNELAAAAAALMAARAGGGA